MSSSQRCEIVVDAGSAGARLDVFLAGAGLGLSRSAAARLIEEGHVLVNGEDQASKKKIVAEGDEVQAEIPADGGGAGDGGIEGERIPLDIRFEDDYLIVLSKQRGLVCHPAPGHPNHTLANALVYHCGADHLGHLQGDDRPGIVHRLDQDTTGLMLAAKDDETQAALQNAIRVRSVDRRYLALVHGEVGPDTGLIDAPIARSVRERVRMAVSEDPSARPSITTFSVLERFEAARGDDGYSLLECHLFTGRTHQIRVHMAYISHPVVGDQLYGKGTDRANLGLDRQFLHSWSLAFEHPVTKERLSFVDDVTYELREAIESLEERSCGRTARGDEVHRALERFEVMREHGLGGWGGQDL